MIIYANKRILKRSPWKEYKLYLLNFLIFVFAVALDYNFPIQAVGYLDLPGKAVVISIIVIIVYCTLNIAIFANKFTKII